MLAAGIPDGIRPSPRFNQNAWEPIRAPFGHLTSRTVSQLGISSGLRKLGETPPVDYLSAAHPQTIFEHGAADAIMVASQ